MLLQSPEPEAHDKVLDNNPDRIGFWNCWFLRRGENRRTRRKTSRSKDENQQQTQPTHDAESGNQSRATLEGGERSQHCAIPAPRDRPVGKSTLLHAFCKEKQQRKVVTVEVFGNFRISAEQLLKYSQVFVKTSDL